MNVVEELSSKNVISERLAYFESLKYGVFPTIIS